MKPVNFENAQVEIINKSIELLKKDKKLKTDKVRLGDKTKGKNAFPRVLIIPGDCKCIDTSQRGISDEWDLNLNIVAQARSNNYKNGLKKTSELSGIAKKILIKNLPHDISYVGFVKTTNVRAALPFETGDIYTAGTQLLVRFVTYET